MSFVPSEYSAPTALTPARPFPTLFSFVSTALLWGLLFSVLGVVIPGSKVSRRFAWGAGIGFFGSLGTAVLRSGAPR